MAAIDPRAYDETGVEEMTRPGETRGKVTPTPMPPKPAKPKTPVAMLDLDDHGVGDEATRMSSIESITAMDRVRQQQPQTGNHDERTRAVNIRNDPSMSEVDWDLD
jgi:hypothetical protein